MFTWVQFAVAIVVKDGKIFNFFLKTRIDLVVSFYVEDSFKNVDYDQPSQVSRLSVQEKLWSFQPNGFVIYSKTSELIA